MVSVLSGGLLSVQQAVRRGLPYGDDSLRLRLRTGRAHGLKLGRDWLIPESEVQRLLELAEVEHGAGHHLEAIQIRALQGLNRIA